MTSLEKYLARQEAIRIAGEAIKKAGDSAGRSDANRAMVLATSFAKRSDLPEHISICIMGPKVVDALSALGLHEPISLRRLPGKWWVAYVDIAADNPNFESGGCKVRKVVTTETLQNCFSTHYREVVAGPFDSEGDAK